MFIAFTARFDPPARYRPRWSRKPRHGSVVYAVAHDIDDMTLNKLGAEVIARCTDRSTLHSAVFAGEVDDRASNLKIDWQGRLLDIPIPGTEPRALASVEYARDRVLVQYEVEHPDGLPVVARLVHRDRAGTRSTAAVLDPRQNSASLSAHAFTAGARLILEVTDGRFIIDVELDETPEHSAGPGPLILRPQPDDLHLRGDAVRAHAVEPTPGVEGGLWWSSLDGELVEGAEALLRLSPGEHELRYTSNAGTASVSPVTVIDYFRPD